ncbi:MAG: outer membrane protein assembly factor BamE (lipoprotein component of BamABCDE complex) [Halieaceae bacterium]|jgi:outer membrane protein assembly factor BamE (lipoprotein component of BamABCDE complex)
MKYLPAALLALLLSACAQYESERGVEVTWEAAQMATFERGVTTRTEVMAALGPPSQLVSLGDESVLYYLNEVSSGRGLILVVYNRFDVDANYERAVFIFDADHVLSDYAGWVAPDAEG